MEWAGAHYPPPDIPQPHQGLGLRLVAGAWSEVEAQPRLWRLPARTRVFVSHTKLQPGSRPPERLGETERQPPGQQFAPVGVSMAAVQGSRSRALVSGCRADKRLCLFGREFRIICAHVAAVYGDVWGWEPRLGQTPPRPSQIVTVLIGGVDCFIELKQQNKPHNSKFLWNPQKSRCLLVESCLTLDDLCVFINHNKRQSQPGLVHLAMYR